mmetsp:Transcript_71572/g.155516  ORF Transcript_71572/g.155516 Transcript_71572/m.155516 type:complete len:275 (-) Transcript_71572:152-976(-)
MAKALRRWLQEDPSAKKLQEFLSDGACCGLGIREQKELAQTKRSIIEPMAPRETSSLSVSTNAEFMNGLHQLVSHDPRCRWDNPLDEVIAMHAPFSSNNPTALGLHDMPSYRRTVAGGSRAFVEDAGDDLVVRTGNPDGLEVMACTQTKSNSLVDGIPHLGESAAGKLADSGRFFQVNVSSDDIWSLGKKLEVEQWRDAKRIWSGSIFLIPCNQDCSARKSQVAYGYHGEEGSSKSQPLWNVGDVILVLGYHKACVPNNFVDNLDNFVRTASPQ